MKSGMIWSVLREKIFDLIELGLFHDPRRMCLTSIRSDSFHTRSWLGLFYDPFSAKFRMSNRHCYAIGFLFALTHSSKLGSRGLFHDPQRLCLTSIRSDSFHSFRIFYFISRWSCTSTRHKIKNPKSLSTYRISFVPRAGFEPARP